MSDTSSSARWVFNDYHRELFWEQFSERPYIYVSSVAKRLLGVTLFYKPFNRFESPPVVLRHLLHAAPFLGLIVLLRRRAWNAGLFPVALTLYVMWLLPYVGVAFYIRYLLPLMPVLVLFVYWGLDALLSTAARARTLPRVAAITALVGLCSCSSESTQPPLTRPDSPSPAKLSSNATLVERRDEAGSCPNVFVLLVDCLRADHLSAVGYHRQTTSQIDRLADDGVLFTQAIAPSTFTKTSIASLFTGRDPNKHGVYSGGADQAGNVVSDVLPESEVTLAEVLSVTGYRTIGLALQAHLRGYMGFAQGFDEYDADAGGTYEINQRLLDRLALLGQSDGIFAYLHYIDLHDPYMPWHPYDTMYGVYRENLYDELDLGNWSEQLRQIRDGEQKLDERQVLQLIANYDGLLTFIDGEIGDFLDVLRRRGLYDDALIILTSDHGDAFMEHGFISHSSRPYDELIHVPLIMKLPGGHQAGRVVTRQVRLIDVMPTVLDIVGVGYTIQGSDAESLLPDMEGQPRTEVSPIAVSEFAYSVDSTYPTVALRTADRKYIHYPNSDWDELFDLSSDPGETINLRDRRQEEAREWLGRAQSIAGRFRRDSKPRTKIEESDAEALRSLGYLQ